MGKEQKNHIMNIALVAHDSRKKELIEWAKYNMKVLSENKLYATGTTGKLLKEAYLDWWEDLECEYDIKPLTENWERHEKDAEELITCLPSEKEVIDVCDISFIFDSLGKIRIEIN